LFSYSISWANYLFNFFVDKAISRFDLVQQMQLGYKLQNAWMMFDHIKHVQGWTTMAYHIYDRAYCKVMMIIINALLQNLGAIH
jgi:predicted AAA+ superfamily ATPase